MADDLEINVKTSADTSGLDQTAQAGQKVEQQLVAAGEVGTKAGEQIATAQKEAAASTTQAAAAQATLNREVAGTSDASIRELIQSVRTLIDQAASAGVTFDRMEQHLARAGREGGAALQPVARNAGEVKEKLTEAEHAAEHFISAIKAGVGIDIGHRIVETVSELPAKFQEALKEGIEFNTRMEVATVGLAGAFRAAEPERLLNFGQARVEGERAMDALKAKANELGLDTHALMEGLSINLHALGEGGIRDVQQQIDIITTLNQAAQAKGLQGFQANRDIMDLLNGRANRTLFGAELGINDADVKAAREAGTLYEFLTEKLSAYKEAGQEAANTFAASEQRLKNETEQLYGEIAKPIFAQLKDAYAVLAQEIANPEVADSLRGLGYDIASVVEAGADLAAFAIRHADLLVTLGTGIGLVTFALAAYKTAQIAAIVGARLTSLVAETEATAAETAAVGANTVAVEANTAAKVANAAAGAVGGTAGGVAAGGAVVGGAAAAGGLGTAVGEAGVAATAGTVALGLIPGVGIYGVRQHSANQEGAADQAAGEDMTAQNERLNKLRDDIARATTPDAQVKTRNALRDELDTQRRALADLQGPDVPGNAWQTAPSRTREDTDKIEHLKVYISLLAQADAGSAKLAGSNPLGNDGKQASALDAYHKSGEYELAQARESGDADRIAKAEHRLAVEKEIDRLTTKEGLSPKAAEQEAEHLVTAKELSKETEHLNTLADAVAKKAERQQSAAELTATATARTADILRQLPPDRAGALGASPDAGAVASAVLALPPAKTDAEVESRRTLLKLTQDLLTLDQARDAAAKREDTQKAQADKDAAQEAANAKQREDAIQDENDETAILAARGRGEKDLADTLEKQRDIRRETTRLQLAGVEASEAQRLAIERVEAANAASDEKAEDREARRHRRPEREVHHRRGDRETVPLRGYSDPDLGGGLHTGSLTTGSLGGSGRSGAADALAGASTYVPSFPRSADGFGTATLRGNPLAGAFAGSVLGPAFGVPTASSFLAPLGISSDIARPSGAQSAAPGADDHGVSDAARQTTQATQANTAATRETFAAVAAELRAQKQSLEEARREIENLKGQLKTTSDAWHLTPPGRSSLRAPRSPSWRPRSAFLTLPAAVAARSLTPSRSASTAATSMPPPCSPTVPPSRSCAWSPARPRRGSLAG